MHRVPPQAPVQPVQGKTPEFVNLMLVLADYFDAEFICRNTKSKQAEVTTYLSRE
jgi:hypothetical protein